MSKKISPWFAYILRCAGGFFYTGISNDLTKRVEQHNLGNGAKYTRGRLPVKLVYSEKCADHSAALKREHAIKKLTRSQKEALIASPPQSNSAF